MKSQYEVPNTLQEYSGNGLSPAVRVSIDYQVD